MSRVTKAPEKLQVCGLLLRMRSMICSMMLSKVWPFNPQEKMKLKKRCRNLKSNDILGISLHKSVKQANKQTNKIGPEKWTQ